MPGGDRTGPMGAGPMTGRGAGFCGGSQMPGYANLGRCRGRGFGRGRSFAGGGRGGRGFRHMFYATGLPGWARDRGVGQAGAETERQWLEEQARIVAGELEQMRRRLTELKQRTDPGGSV
jgi:hypothetical protein